MSNFNQRFGVARAWELGLRDKLRERGYSADLFGQGQLSDYWHKMLQGYRDSFDRPTLVRWMPDIIAATPDDPSSIVFIDAKTGTAKTGNYSVEINAHNSALAFENLLYVPVLFVWQDGGVLTTHAIGDRHFTRKDGANTTGSGTSFYLVQKRFATSVGARFPVIPSRQETA